MFRLWAISTTLTIVSQIYLVGCNVELSSQHKVESSLGDDGPVEFNSSFSAANHYDKLSINQPTLRVQHDIFTEKQMDIIYRFYTRLDQFHGNYTVAELGMIALTAKFHSLTTNDQPKHRYDSLSDLRDSFGPHIDNQHCLRHLESWNGRAKSLREQKFRSRDLNLYRLLDSYGQVSAGWVANSASWTGMYEECLSLGIDSPDDHAITPTRYCLASIKHQHWPTELLGPYNQLFAPEVGVCLPKSCDPLSFRNKYDLILQLIEFNWRDMDKGQAELVSLYCLPDDDSPLRTWWRSTWAATAMIVVGSWLVALIYATLKYEQGRKLASSDRQLMRYCQILSLTRNFKLLFNVGQQPKPLDTPNNQLAVIDFRCMDGIKVITMLATLVAHVLILASDPLFNRTDVIMLEFLMVAAVSQSLFFAMSGILNCYSLSKRIDANGNHHLNPINWLASIRSRYLRIMPMYAIHVYYIKHLLKYTGSGPRWDYGTSSLGMKRQCENESWLWTLMFGANFKAVLEHCSNNGWYLANDFQFFLVTPIFLFLLHRRPSIGRKLLKFCMAASCLAGILSMLLSGAPDMRPLNRPMPHSFNTLMAYQTPSYTQPQFRISAYMCGLLIGFELLTYEQAKKKYLSLAKKKTDDNDDNDNGKLTDFKHWPDWLVNHGWKFRVAIPVLFLYLMIACFYVEPDKLDAIVYISLYVPTNHLLFALGLGSYILTATTGYGNQSVRGLLAAPFWKPLAKLSLCISLINIEFIRYMDQSPKQQNYLHRWNLIGQMVLTIVGSYLGATLTHLLFEAPISGLLNHLRL